MPGTDGTPLAAEDPETTHFEATVTAIDDRMIGLDRTYFYPEGGGQPPDRGTVAGTEVVDVQWRDGEIFHTLTTEPDIAVGATVEGRIDETFRTYAMRAHTASHVLYGAGRRLFEEHGYGGFDIGEETVRLDFETSRSADSVNALAIQRLANEAVWDGRPVTWSEMAVSEARADDEIVFNRGPAGASDGSVRIVDVEGWDVSACGGTHVRNTIEIGPVQILAVSNPGADLVRVEYAVGERAIDHWLAERRQASRAASALDTSVADLPDRVADLAAETSALETQVEDLGERLLDARLSALASETVPVAGEEWLVGTVEALGPNDVAEALEDGVAASADVAVLAGRDGSTFVVVGTDGETDASEVIEDVTTEFGGGGGGGPTLAQGGGIDAPPAAVVDYLRSGSDR